ncbi:MAG: protein kinase [Deltaproteobacteria bacterium]|nr:protein kinase [Deltaproteobacteria bacterium]
MTPSSGATATWAPGQLVPGTVYRIVRPLGQGGMGEVYEVEHDNLGQRRALKVLARDFAGRDDLAERLRVEARGLARLKHPNLVEVYDLATAADERIFFVMELLDGSTLRDLQRQRGRLGVLPAVQIMAQVLDALHVAHQAALIHRDIKPENIFICRSKIVKLLDFGVAKTIDAWMPAQQLTGTGMTVGTPRYMSPEQAEGRVVDARSDLYSAGLVLWETLTGRAAFSEPDPVDMLKAKLTRGVMPLDAAMLGIPESLAQAVMTACDRDPARRQATAAQFAIEIRRAVGEDERPWAVSITPQPEPVRIDTVAAAPIASAPVTTRDRATAPDRPGPGDRTAAVPGFEADQATGHAMDRTDAQPGAAHHELTERIDAAGVDPDSPTRTSVEAGPQMMGPTGTQMLPAVAAQHCPTELAESPARADTSHSVQKVWVHPSESSATAAAPKRSSAVWWIVGVAAFVVPIGVAAAIGAAHLRARPAQVASSAPTTSAETAAQPGASSAPTQEAAIPTQSAAPSASAPAEPLAVTTSRKPPQREPVAAKTGGAATSKVPASKPPPQGTSKLPASGL